MRYHDYQQDSNTALMELEKGLRSIKPGEQCEAIVAVPELLEQHPYPLLVNSACLKLADVFRAGSNLLKLCVLKALQSSSKHIDKIFNVDEFSHRFFVVIHSNDPVARSITLRVFGSIASVVADRKDIHHCIRNSLDSHDAIEVEAAIFATEAFAKQSSVFAVGMWQKISEIVRKLTTPIDLKIKLLPVLKYMHHDLTVVKQVNDLCKELMESYPGKQFVVEALKTTTHLALSTIVNINEQVELLLHYALMMPQRSINLVALWNLYKLVVKAAYLWNEGQVERLLVASSSCSDPVVRKRVMEVAVLLSASTVHLFNEKSLKVLQESSMATNIEICTCAMHAQVNVSSCRSGCDFGELESNVTVLFSESISESSMPSFMRCLRIAEKLMNHKDNKRSTLPAFFVEVLSHLDCSQRLLTCRTLVSVASQKDHLLKPFSSKLLELLTKQVCNVQTKNDRDLVVALCTLIYQSEVSSSYIKCTEQLYEQNELWTLFRISRQAARLLYPDISAKILSMLTTKVSTEAFHFWLKSLESFYKGECCFMNSSLDLRSMLVSSHNHYLQGLTYLKAGVTTEHFLYFQFKFSRLRSDLFKSYMQLLTCCTSLNFNPALLHQTQQTVSNFQHCVGLFTNIAQGYESLYKSSFNADPNSLTTIQLLHESCQLVVYAIKTLASEKSKDRVCPTFTPNLSVCGHYARKITEKNLSFLQTIENAAADKRNDCITQKQADCLVSIIKEQLSVGFSFPLYFYKRLQNTEVKLSITPKNEDTTMVNIQTEMILKVEGIVLNHAPTCFRQVKKVNLQVSIAPTENVRNTSRDLKPVQFTETNLSESSCLKNDYFSAQFLLSFNYIGHHVINISAGVQDESGVDWETGPSACLYVEVYEHGLLKKK